MKMRKPHAAQNVHTLSSKKELWNIYVFAMSYRLSHRIAARESDRIYTDWKRTSGGRLTVAMMEIGALPMEKIKFGCDDIEIPDDSAFESKASLIPANCIAVDMPDGSRKIYAYSGYLGPRFWGTGDVPDSLVGECETVDAAVISVFPYDIQSTIHDKLLDEEFGRGKWRKIVGSIGCRLPVGFDREKLNSGDASTTNIIVRDAYFSGEFDPMLVASNTVTRNAWELLGDLIGGESKVAAINRFANLWYEITAWMRVDNLDEMQIREYIRMLNAARAVKLAEPDAVDDLSICIPGGDGESDVSNVIRRVSMLRASKERKRFQLRVSVGDGIYHSEEPFDADGFIRFLVAVMPFVEAGVSIDGPSCWNGMDTGGTIESRDDAYRLGHFATLRNCDGGYSLALRGFVTRSVAESQWGPEVIANDEKFAVAVIESLGRDGLSAVRDAVGSYRFDRIAVDMARKELCADGDGVDDDWIDVALADPQFEPPAEPWPPACDDSVIDGDACVWTHNDDDDWYDDCPDDYDRQLEEYESAFRNSLPFMSAQTRSSLFAALPGLSRFADEATGEPLDRVSDGGEE